MSQILIAEDNPHIARFLSKGLRADGYATFVVHDGADAERLALSGEFDLLLLDLGLPSRGGFQVLHAVRGSGLPLPVFVLTGRRERDVVACLDAGADDYMTKPFRMDELLARVRTRLRAHNDRDATILQAAGVTLDLHSRQARMGERTVDLTSREFALLETFVRHPGQVLSREQLLSHVWGYDSDPSSNVVNVYVNQLRNKLGHAVIQTVRGFGYRLART